MVGAGISGLLSTLALSKEGYPVMLLEASPQIGGVCRSYEVNGYTVDSGPHIVTRLGAGPLRQLMDQYFDVTPTFVPHGEYHVRMDGEIRAFPWTLKSFAKFDPIPPSDRLSLIRAIVSLYSQKAWGRDLTNISVSQLLQGTVLQKKTVLFLDAMCKFMTGKGMERTSVTRFIDAQDYKNVNGGGTLESISNIKNLILKKGAMDHYYPIGGIQSIVGSIIRSFPEGMVTIKCNCPVERILTEDDAVRGVVADGIEYSANTIIYAAPCKDLPNFVPSLPTDYSDSLNSLKTIQSLTLWLGLDSLCGINPGSEIWPYSDPPLWVVPTSSFDSSLAPSGKQLVGFTTTLPPNYDLDDEKSRILDTIYNTIPEIEDQINNLHWQVLVPEKASWDAHFPMPSQITPIKGLYLVGTDTIQQSMGITRAAYSVISMLEALGIDTFSTPDGMDLTIKMKYIMQRAIAKLY